MSWLSLSLCFSLSRLLISFFGSIALRSYSALPGTLLYHNCCIERLESLEWLLSFNYTHILYCLNACSFSFCHSADEITTSSTNIRFYRACSFLSTSRIWIPRFRRVSMPNQIQVRSEHKSKECQKVYILAMQEMDSFCHPFAVAVKVIALLVFLDLSGLRTHTHTHTCKACAYNNQLIL